MAEFFSFQHLRDAAHKERIIFMKLICDLEKVVLLIIILYIIWNII